MGFGKTQATKAAVSLLGVQEANFVKNITDAKSFQRTSTTTLGIMIDDPTHLDEIAEKIISHFERGTHETVAAQYTPRTTFITSINMECLQMLGRGILHCTEDLTFYNSLLREFSFLSLFQSTSKE